MLEQNYSTEIELDGEKYNLVFSTAAAWEISDRFGGLDKIGEALSNPNDLGAAFRDVVWLITLLVNQGIKIDNYRNGTKRMLFTMEEVGLFTTLADIGTFQVAIRNAIAKGTVRSVKSEEDPKNLPAG